MGNGHEKIYEARVFESKAEAAIAERDGDETLFVEGHLGGYVVQKVVGGERKVLTTDGKFVKGPWN